MEITGLKEIGAAAQVNPFTETPSGDIVCVDAKVNFDDNAAFRQASHPPAMFVHLPRHVLASLMQPHKGKLRRQCRLPPGAGLRLPSFPSLPQEAH
jgi:hypothetical protein